MTTLIPVDPYQFDETGTLVIGTSEIPDTRPTHDYELDQDAGALTCGSVTPRLTTRGRRSRSHRRGSSGSPTSRPRTSRSRSRSGCRINLYIRLPTGIREDEASAESVVFDLIDDELMMIDVLGRRPQTNAGSSFFPAYVGVPASDTWGVADRMFVIEVSIPNGALISGVAYSVGGTTAGSVRSAIYDANGTLLGSRTTASGLLQAGTTEVDQVAFDAPVEVLAGTYFIGLVANAAASTATMCRPLVNSTVRTSSIPLPSSITVPTSPNIGTPFPQMATYYSTPEPAAGVADLVLSAASATATPTLAMRALTRVVLGSAASLATPTLSVTSGARLVPLAAATCVATPTLSVKAPTRVTLASATCLATPTLVVKAPTKVVLGAAACAASPTLALTAGTPFSPTDISGLLGWWKADALGLSDGATVTSWTDSSGNARHLTGVGTTYETAEINGLAIVRFDGVDDQLSVAFTCNQPHTRFYVAKYRSAFTAQESFADNHSSVGSGRAQMYRPASTTIGMYAAGGITTATTPQAYHVYGVVFNGASSLITIDGAAPVTGSTGTGAGTNTGGIRLGSNASPGEWADADVAEVIVYDTALGTTNRESVEDYLKSKYAL